MFKEIIKLNQSLFVLTLITSFFLLSCAEDEKCYTCKRGSETLQNVCGFYESSAGKMEPLVNHYRSIGYTCNESGSVSKSQTNIIGPEENTTILTKQDEEENSDFPCNDKNNDNSDDSKENNAIE